MPSTINISVPRPLKAWVDQQVKQNGYGTAGEFIRQVIEDRRDQAEAHQRIENQLLKAIASGPATPMTKRDWQQIKRNGMKRLQTTRRQSGQ